MRKILSGVLIIAMVVMTGQHVYADGSDSAAETFMGAIVSGSLSINGYGASASTYADSNQFFAQVKLTYQYVDENTGRVMTIEQTKGGNRTASETISLPSGYGLRSYKAKSIHKVTKQNNIWQRELSAYY